MIRERRSVLYATFVDKYSQNSVDPFSLDNIGNGYDAWTRSETQFLVLAVILIIITLAFAIIVAMDCSRNLNILSFRDIIQRSSPQRPQPNHGIVNLAMDEIKAPPVNILAPPPYRN